MNLIFLPFKILFAIIFFLLRLFLNCLEFDDNIEQILVLRNSVDLTKSIRYKLT